MRISLCMFLIFYFISPFFFALLIYFAIFFSPFYFISPFFFALLFCPFISYFQNTNRFASSFLSFQFSFSNTSPFPPFYNMLYSTIFSIDLTRGCLYHPTTLHTSHDSLYSPNLFDSPTHRLTRLPQFIRLTTTHNDSQRLTTTHNDSQRLTTTHNDSQRLTTTHNDSLDFPNLFDSQRLTTTHNDTQRLTTTHNDSQRLTTTHNDSREFFFFVSSLHSKSFSPFLSQLFYFHFILNIFWMKYTPS